MMLGISVNKFNFLHISFLFLSLIFGACTHEEEVVDDRLAVLRVPEGYVIEEAVLPGLAAYPMFASFDDHGRLFVFESVGVNTMGTEKMLAEPTYRIRLLADTDDDGVFDKGTIYVDSVPLPMGGTFHQGSLYAAVPPNLMQYTDTDGDGIADDKKVILSGWTLNANAATLHGPFMGPDGWLYLCDARRGFEIESKEGETLVGKSARIWRCRPDGSGLEAMSGGGFDNTIEMVFMPGGETVGTMTYFTDPQDGQRDALMHWVEGGVYPKYNSVIDEDELTLTGEFMPVMTKLPRIAHSGLHRYRGDALGEAFDGNLFSAVFNTGKITRHIIEPDGATFKTQEVDFMTSTDSDTHPTDVLQDADGSLLVVITGGWFIEGCPLSRVAKPDVHGGIYRIRKKDFTSMKDPWGKALKLDQETPEKLKSYLDDPRLVVRDQAMEQLVKVGPSAITTLAALFDSKDETIRASAVFALSRIQSPESQHEVRKALDDSSVVVRTAAARCLGLARDTASVARLMELVQFDEAPVRRQAATALGQIGALGSVTALLNAAETANDRFVEHAIIHTLIVLGQPESLVAALGSPSAGTRRAAVIALDQMDRSPLRQEQLLPFLLSTESQLRETGIWVASHRPEWSKVVVDFLKKGPFTSDISTNETESIVRLLITFSSHPELQAYISAQLGSPTVSSAHKLLLLDVIAGSAVSTLPDAWVKQLAKLLRGTDEAQRGRVLEVIELRGVSVLNTELAGIIADSSMMPDFRLQALRARVATSPELSENEFRMLADYLGPGVESPVRQSAARLLARSKLNEQQLLEIINTHVATIDLFLLPNVITALHGSTSESVGNALLEALGRSPERLESLSEKDVKQLFDTFPVDVKTASEKLIDQLKARHAERLSKLKELEESLGKGDASRGRVVFFGKGACFTCHTVGDEGVNFGPDLSNIGEIRSRHDILEAIVYPSASFAREYDTYQVKTASKTYVGVIREQLSDAIILAVGPGADVRIPRSDVLTIEPHDVSMMPPGLEKNLSEGELSDLMTFLKSLPDDYITLE